jgi:hypothetical protein
MPLSPVGHHDVLRRLTLSGIDGAPYEPVPPQRPAHGPPANPAAARRFVIAANDPSTSLRVSLVRRTASRIGSPAVRSALTPEAAVAGGADEHLLPVSAALPRPNANPRRAAALPSQDPVDANGCGVTRKRRSVA